MSTFTDEDLKEWKVEISAKGINIEIPQLEFEALLARLEESEKLNDAFINGFKDAVEFRLKTWRKSKGEGGA